MPRTSEQIRTEIVERFGFFPPFFEPAFEDSLVLENLWQQTLTAYVDNPLPNLFKEKLAAMLARYCSIPYCLMCHSASLRPLGMTATEVLRLLESAPLSYDELQEKMRPLLNAPKGAWPSPGSMSEEAILSCCISIFLNQDIETCQRHLRTVLSPRDYQYLTLFLAYNRTALSWVEMYPELSFEEDERTKEHLAPLLREEPALADFFANYLGRSSAQASRQFRWLTQENKRILDSERRRLDSYFAQAPVGFAIFEEPEHTVRFSNPLFDSLTRTSGSSGKVIREVLKGSSYASLFDRFDSSYTAGIGFSEYGKEFGNGISVDLRVEPYRNESGEVRGLIVILVDVTERVRLRSEITAAHEKVNEAKAHLDEAIAVTKIGFFDWNLITNEFKASNEFLQCWGAESSPNAEDFFALILPEDVERVRRDVQTGIATGSYHSQYRVRRKSDGSVVWFNADGRVDRNDQGQPGRFIGTTIDITDRKIAENVIFEVANSIPQLAWTADPSGSITWYNERWYEYTGTTFEKMAGWGWTSVHDPAHVDRVVRKFKDAWSRGVEWEDTFPLRGADGGYRWFLSQAVPIRDKQGNIARWFGTNTDITAQLDAERTSTRMAAVVQSSTEFVGMSDENLIPIFVNESGRKMVGLGSRDVTKIPILEYFPPSDQTRVETEVFPTLLAKGYWEGELSFRHFETGDLIPVLYNLFPIREAKENRLLGYATVTRNISERKRLEQSIIDSRDEAERANTAKSAFLANMSHEIRTPLGAIMGFAELARDGKSAPHEVANYLQTIEKNSVQVLRIIDDILDLAKVEAGRVDLEIMEVHLTSFLADFASLMGFRARENGIVLRLRAETDLPTTICTDPTRLRQILTNAVGNAIKFTDQGSVTVHVCFKDDFLHFGVEDTGRGISADQAGRLFKAFSQADVSTTRKFGGTGLGLVLTKRLCQLMGGDYRLERSELGVGSKFDAKLRIHRPDSSRMLNKKDVVFHRSTTVPSKPADGKLTNTHVLLVEDSPDNQVLIRILLERQGATLEVAGDGRSGVEKALAGHYDIILMDIQMPVMDGHEAVRMLRATGYGEPVVALTAHAMKEEIERAMASGFTTFLTKPVQRDQLISTIRGLTKPHG